MITKEEFAKAFTQTMKGDLSPAEFARQAIEYMKSPDYNRWKAAHEAEKLRMQREAKDAAQQG